MARLGISESEIDVAEDVESLARANDPVEQS